MSFKYQNIVDLSFWNLSLCFLYIPPAGWLDQAHGSVLCTRWCLGEVPLQSAAHASRPAALPLGCPGVSAARHVLNRTLHLLLPSKSAPSPFLTLVNGITIQCEAADLPSRLCLIFLSRTTSRPSARPCWCHLDKYVWTAVTFHHHCCQHPLTSAVLSRRWSQGPHHPVFLCVASR